MREGGLLRLTSNALIALCVVVSISFFSGCMPIKQARVAAVAFTARDVATAASKQSDPAVVREGTPAYLMLVDGLLESYPENEELLVAACNGYSSYASLLPEEDAARAGALHLKAKRYGFRALSDDTDFGQAASGNLEAFQALLKQYDKKDAPALFCTASAWASWISANLGSVEAMGDLPMLEATMQRVLELDDTLYRGGPHVMMGVYLAAKPPAIGGDLVKSKRHFDRAFALGSDKVLMSRVLYAQYYARGIGDRELYMRTLQEVVAAPTDEIPELTLSNTVAQEKAKRLLEKTEETFEAQP